MKLSLKLMIAVTLCALNLSVGWAQRQYPGSPGLPEDVVWMREIYRTRYLLFVPVSYTNHGNLQIFENQIKQFFFIGVLTIPILIIGYPAANPFHCLILIGRI